MSIRTKLELNQKGFVIAPVILWIVGALVLTGTVAVKEGLISVDLSEKITHDGSRTGARVGYQSYCNPEQGVVIYENEKMPFVTDEGEQVLWTQGDIDCYKERKLAEKNIQVPIPTPLPPIQPKPTQKPVVQQGVQANQNTQQPTHDGSRTGRIVDYRSLCEGKVIKVYENELVPYKRITGEMIYTTKGDIKCYEDQINQLKNEAYGTQETYYQVLTNIRPPSLPRYEPPKINIPPPPKIEPYVSQYTAPTFTVDPPLQIRVEPEPCVVVPPGFGGATSGRVNEAGFPCAN